MKKYKLKLKSYHKIPCFYPDGSVNFYTPQLVSTTDYYAFGQIINARTYSVGGQKYRYNHNGHEIEDDIADGVVSAEFWMYDGRLGRRWEMDPIEIVGVSSYATFANNPIYFSDPDGLKPKGLGLDGCFNWKSFKAKIQTAWGKVRKSHFGLALGKFGKKITKTIGNIDLPKIHLPKISINIDVGKFSFNTPSIGLPSNINSSSGGAWGSGMVRIPKLSFIDELVILRGMPIIPFNIHFITPNTFINYDFYEAPDRLIGVGLGKSFKQSFNTGWVPNASNIGLNPNGIGIIIMKVQGGNILDQLIFRNLWKINRSLDMALFPGTKWEYQIQRQAITLIKSFEINMRYIKLKMSLK